ncbi:MAG: filamentous hemagglutinin N-terminal domain-containing protein [Brasilonema octagenarum HA4186-MV1]|jgi:filamentous hemagglutinin family protein|nr:filamentous hemagglutinin N-terminal domain-containing protein [Brasilonema octagenarum HA4186-MV1]
MKQGWHSLILFTLPLCAIGSLTFLDTATAQQVTQQVTPDGTVSTTVTTPDGKNFTINDGTTRGGNLFHSFKEFSVPTGGSANFNNAADVLNIIGRVTGGSVSNIDGAIRALGKANVFLLNPAGIIFGPNASLNIGGSFLGSTAHSFVFDNGFEFSATNPQAPPLLTINVPIGLRYRDNPGNIQVRGPVTGSGLVSEVRSGNRPKLDSNVTGLQVEPGKTLALVGGNVFVEGGVLRSQGGRIEIGSFDSNQIVNLVPAQSEGFSLAYQGTPSFRDIEFSNKSFVNVTGDGSGSIAILGRNINFTSDSILLSDTLGDKNGGEISIVGDSIAFNRSSLLSNTFGSGNGGQIKLDANKINFDNRSGVSIQTQDNKGNAGDINIRANSLEMKGSSSLVSITTGSSSGKAGNINIAVNGPMAITSTGIQADSNGVGNAGNININANSLQIENSGVFSRANYKGQGGEINITVADSLTSIKNTNINTNAYNTGDAGKINIRANSFRLEQQGGVLSEAGASSTGKAGEINITVAGSLELLNKVGISTTTAGIGDAGNINITAGSFLLEGSGVSSSTTENSTGNAGEVNITAGLFKINAASMRTNNLGSGNAGDLKVQATSLVLDGAGLYVNSTGNGNAGNLEIKADTIKLDGSELNANTSGGKGNITLNSRDLILRKNSNITTNAQGTAGGGNITINTGNLVAFEDSNITADAVKGYGGEVNITARGIFRSPDSDITAISEAGPQFNGIVQFNTPEIDPTQGLFELTETVIDPAQQVAQNPCIKGFGSTFTITGRGGLPSDPNKILSSDNVRVDLVEPVPSKVSSTSTTQKQPSQKPPVKKIIPVRGWIYNEKGQVVLVGYDPTKTGPQREQPAPTTNCAATR